MSVRGEDRKSDADGYHMSFDSGDEDADFDDEKAKKPLKKSTDDEGSPPKPTARRLSQGAKYVPPKINVKMPPQSKVGQVSSPTKQEDDKKKQYRSAQQGHQQSQQYHQSQGGSQKKIPDVTPPSYMHNLDKQPMTNREKFMCYKVQRLEAKLEKTSNQLQKFRTGYQNLVRGSQINISNLKSEVNIRSISSHAPSAWSLRQRCQRISVVTHSVANVVLFFAKSVQRATNRHNGIHPPWHPRSRPPSKPSVHSAAVRNAVIQTSRDISRISA